MRKLTVLTVILLLLLAVAVLPAQAHLASCGSASMMGLVTIGTVVSTFVAPPVAALGWAYQVLAIVSAGWITYDGWAGNDCYDGPDGHGDCYGDLQSTCR